MNIVPSFDSERQSEGDETGDGEVRGREEQQREQHMLELQDRRLESDDMQYNMILTTLNTLP